MIPIESVSEIINKLHTEVSFEQSVACKDRFRETGLLFQVRFSKPLSTAVASGTRPLEVLEHIKHSETYFRNKFSSDSQDVFFKFDMWL